MCHNTIREDSGFTACILGNVEQYDKIEDVMDKIDHAGN
jgi:cobalamin biosynthesis Co2+ chelatase CbiK